MTRWLISPLLLFLLVGLVASCSETGQAIDSRPTYSPTHGPILGAADGTDSADRSCQLVLREVGRRSNGTGGYIDDGHEWVWFGTVDVDAALIDAGATVAVMYRTSAEDAWWEVQAFFDGHVDGDFRRLAFQIDEHVVGPGMSGTSISRSWIELVPVAHQSNGGRLFDHNRNPGDFDNYYLRNSNDWRIEADDSVCSEGQQPDSDLPGGDGPGGETGDVAELVDAAPEAVLSFTEDWQIEQTGTLVANGQLTVNYDLSRLPECRGTHNGYPAWDIVAFAQFWPGGQVMDATVRNFETELGRPTTNAFAVPAEFEVPSDAEWVEIWFWNQSLASGGCESWDSNFEQNYAFDVLPLPQWIGNAVVNISRSANHPCEGGQPLVDSFTYGTWERTRAAMRYVCFEVYQEGVTDRSNPDLWQELDVRAHWRYDDGEFASQYLSLVDQPGNNARYAVDVGALDPFRYGNCPEGPVARVETPTGEIHEQSTMELFFTVNGVPLQPESDASTFRGDYWDTTSALRDANCQ